MSIMSRVGGLLSPSDPELVNKTLARLAEQDTWNDIFSTKLIELLDSIDLVKSEIRQELRAVEVASQAASRKYHEALDTRHVAEQDYLRAVRLFQKAIWCAGFAVAASWIATLWLAWLVFHPALSPA